MPLFELPGGSWVDVRSNLTIQQRQEADEILARSRTASDEIVPLLDRLAAHLAPPDGTADETRQLVAGELPLPAPIAVLERVRDDLTRWVDRLER